MPSNRCRRGFTLTEILLAAGILGVGLTMVASVFPISVDQNRRSVDLTHSAMCARNVAATLRARRTAYSNGRGVVACIRYCPNSSGTSTTLGTTSVPLTNVIALGTGPALPDEFSVYNPYSFLYEQGTVVSTTTSFSHMYKVGTSTLVGSAPPPSPAPHPSLGDYFAIVYATTLSSTPRIGPFRLTIVVYRSYYGGGLPPTNYSWGDTAGTATATSSQVGAGDFIIDPNPYRGEAYMIDAITYGSTSPSPSDLTNDPLWYQHHALVWLAPGMPCLPLDGTAATAEPKGGPGTGSTTVYNPPTYYTPTVGTGSAKWKVLPQAVAVFHTLIGD